MAKTLSTSGIVDGQLATAAHLTQSLNALTGEEAYDLTISGSVTITGSLSLTGSTDLNGNLAIPGFPDVSHSLASAGGANGFPYSGSAEITGSLNIIGGTGFFSNRFSGSTEMLNPDETITLRNTSGSTFRAFGTNGPGVFLDINQTDTGLGNTSLMFGNINPDINGLGAVLPITGLLANYVTGSDGASGSISFFTGQRDFTAIGGQIHTLISLEYEPGKLLSNNDPEVTLKVGESDTNSYRESIDGRYINTSTGETAQLTIGETDSTNAQQVNIKNLIIGTSGSYETFTSNKSPNNTFLIQGMISESGETGLSYDGNNYNVYTSTTSSLSLDIGDIGFSDKGPSYVLSYARDKNNFNAQNTQVRIGHNTLYGGTVNITEYRNNSTSSMVGFFTGSAGYDNQQEGALPLVIYSNIAGVVNSTSPALVIEQTFPETGSTPNPTFRINHNGNISKVGNITSTGTISTTTAISSSATIIGNKITGSTNISSPLYTGSSNTEYHGQEFSVHGNNANSGFTILSLTNKPSIQAGTISPSVTSNAIKIGNLIDSAILLSASTSSFTGNLSGSATSTGSMASLQIIGKSIDFTDLPTSDPGVVGRLYRDGSGNVKISI